MMSQSIIDAALILVVLLNLAMLATSRLARCVRIFAMQSLLLAALPLLLELQHTRALGLHPVSIAFGAAALKVIVIPWVLLRVLRTGEIHREVEPMIGFTASMLLGSLIVIACFAFGHRLVLPVKPQSDLLLSVSMATVLNGLLILVSRVKAITQVVGFLIVENGVFIFGLLLLEQTPVLVELGILLDLFVAVFIMGIVVYHIRREFDHMDTNLLDALKES
jgi:hydrogenase-4 component E